MSRDPLDYHDPTAGIGGAPPARSALGLRLALATFGVLTCVALAIAFALIDQPAIVVLCAVLALVAVVDIAVVTRRLRRERRQPW